MYNTSKYQKEFKFGIILPIVLLSYALILIDNSIVATSASAISASLKMNETTLSWVTNSYTITFGSLLLFAGRIGDFIGRKKIFLIGLAVFGMSSLFVGLSYLQWQIITARSIQGIGAAIIAPNSLALLLDSYEGKQRAIAVGYYGITAAIGSSVGLLMGGFLTTIIGWQSGFLVNVPYTIILFILTYYFVTNNANTPNDRLDVLGAILSILMSASFVYGIVEQNPIIFCFSILLLIIFLFHEHHEPKPLVPLGLFKDLVRSSSYIGRFIFMMFMMSYWFLLPQIMYRLFGTTPLLSGITFLTLTFAQTVAAIGQSKMKIHYTTKILLGELLIFIGITCSTLNAPSFSNFFFIIEMPMILIGLGAGFLLAPLTYAGVQGITSELSGSASGVTNTMHQLGGPFGISLVVLMSSSTTHDNVSYYFSIMQSLMLFSGLGLLLSIALKIIQSRTQIKE